MPEQGAEVWLRERELGEEGEEEEKNGEDDYEEGLGGSATGGGDAPGLRWRFWRGHLYLYLIDSGGDRGLLTTIAIPT